ncbi:MAG: hypothetical protein EPN97_01925 [Alphaproteobacteria bacterium]|nr:MAG: hypothetical protein EPN97_01925 [Alphaproteobacteria bacterium]
MGIRDAFRRASKRIGIALCCLSMVFLAACGYPGHQLGQDPGLQGTTVVEAMFDGAAAQKHLTIDGASLQSKNAYSYSGPVTIRGDVPANTEISIENGRLEVTGNVGAETKIDVQMPVRTHQESYTYTTFMMVGKVMMPMVHTGHRTVIDGLAFPGDTHPAVKVDGTIGNKVTIRANGGIEAGGWGTELKVETGYGRTLQQVPAPRSPGPSS